AVLSDVNEDLVAAYVAVRDEADFVIRSLSQRGVDLLTFERVRKWNPTRALRRGTRLIYLNKTAFNGIYRVNRNGRFNVPFGCKPNTQLCQPRVIRAASAALKLATLRCADFRVAL